MKKITTIVFIIFVTIVAFFFFVHESEAEGRCTGSASCNICKDCSRCQYCKGGGSCGVCSPRKQKQTTSYSTNNSHSSNGSSHTNIPITKTANTHYFVEPITLSIWKSPSASSDILCTMNEFDSVTLLKMYDLKWAQVEIICNDGNTITGYTLKKSLIKIEE